MTSPPARPPDTPGPVRGVYPSDLERAWQPVGRPRVVIRPLRPTDLETDLHFVEGLSPQTLYLRTQHFGSPTRRDLERLLELDYVDRLAIAAFVTGADGVERIVGVSRYARIDDTRRADCAVVVADDWQAVGLGTELMRTLSLAARQRGFTCLEGTALAENARLVAWARRFGFGVKTEPNSGGQVHVTLELDSLGTAPG